MMPLAHSILRRIVFYGGIAAVVLAYVAITSHELGKKPDDWTPLTRRMILAAGACAAWIAIDIFLSSRFKQTDILTSSLVRVLLGWGLLLALGAMLSQRNQQIGAAAIVFGVTAAFLGLWIAALRTRKAKSSL
jgi:hypothetical protein